MIGESFKADGPRPPKGGTRFRFQFPPGTTVEEMVAEIQRVASSTPQPSETKKPAKPRRKREGKRK